MRSSLAGGDDHLGGGGGGGGGRRGAGRVGEREVVEVSRGRGSVAAAVGGNDGGDDENEWCEGRLWRYADGGLAFVWLPRQPEGGERLVDYERVDVTRERRRGSKKKKKKKSRKKKKKKKREREERRRGAAP